jgi:SAM-dependent methyltransferase
MSNLYRDRARAEGFGALAARYDKARPSYPAELVSWLSQGGKGVAVDVGCGTRRVAQLLTEADWSVIGVEPDERMAEVARSRGIQVVVSRLEQWSAPQRGFDLVCSGTAWHWVDPTVSYDIAAKLLRPGGRLAIFRNSCVYHPDVANAIDAALRRHAPDLLGRCIPLCSSPGNLIAQHASEIAERTDQFAEIEIRTFAHDRIVTMTAWVDELQTHSPIVTLDRLVRKGLLNELERRVAKQAASHLRIQHEAQCVAARRR